MKGTESAIMDAFGQLLDEKPLNKITVKDIVERCEINRNTFYYHFQDIPTLLEQTLNEKADWLIQNHYSPGRPIDCIRPLIQYGVERKRAILHVYKAVPCDRFLILIEKILGYIVREYFENAFSQAMPNPEDKELLVRYYQCTMVGILLDWISADMSYDLLHASERLCTLMEGTGRQAMHKAAQ
ncbi:TetR/AcrR family transcriptional regulator [Pygmaiobacter massiliensis]|uniref:TetR/AcrR family transcriptional regulator n=1 Tax=Pygmaiobacter massiliensis TaxID=1917873 RepID=UPI00289C77C9|nr:TetR/AcrR family transcriptional regulator C-terminal domain-containing protein [Pygmaiobacter massiliensis]